MKLDQLQNLLFKQIVHSPPLPSELLELIEAPKGADKAERLQVYERAYRIRIREAIEEDFPASTSVLGKKEFENLFRGFCAEKESQFKSLNAFGQQWLSYLKEKNLASPLLELASFEWKMVESTYSLESQPRLYCALDSQRGLALDPSLLTLSSPYPLIRMYEMKQLMPLEESHLVLWSREGYIYFRESTKIQNCFIHCLKQASNISEAGLLFMNELGLEESKAAQQIQSSLENLISQGAITAIDRS